MYMLCEGSAPHSPSGGAATHHPTGAQLTTTVQERRALRWRFGRRNVYTLILKDMQNETRKNKGTKAETDGLYI